MLPCLVIVRRQPVLSFRPTSFLRGSPSLFATSANFPPLVFNHFRNLALSEKPFVPCFHTLAHSFALFCTFEKLNSFRFNRLRTLRQKTGLPSCPISPLAVPFWNASPIPTGLLRPERLPASAPSIPAAPRPPKTPPAAGSHTWKPFSSHQSPRDTPAASAQSAGAPSRPHRFPSPPPPAPPQYAGPAPRVPASLSKSETSPACAIPSAAARTASHTARHRSGRFPSNAPSPPAPAACFCSAAPVFASFHAPNAPAASAPAPLPHITPLPFRLRDASQTWLKHRGRKCQSQNEMSYGSLVVRLQLWRNSCQALRPRRLLLRTDN